MQKFYFSLAFIAALTMSGCASMGSGSSEEGAANSLSDSGKNMPKMSDSEMVSAVREAFQKDPQLSAINVTADQGTITLSGNAPSPQAYNRAISVARSVTGRPPVATNLTF